MKPGAFGKALGDRIARARGMRRIRQSAVAEVCGVDPSAVSLWETGRRVPDARHLRDAAVFLNVSVDWLLSLSGGPHLPEVLNR